MIHLLMEICETGETLGNFRLVLDTMKMGQEIQIPEISSFPFHKMSCIVPSNLRSFHILCLYIYIIMYIYNFIYYILEKEDTGLHNQFVKILLELF